MYSLGATLYRLVTGIPPYYGATPSEAMFKVLEEAPALPRKRCPEIPRTLEALIMKCLERHPEERYQTAAELADDLQRFLDGDQVRARRSSLLVRSLTTVRRARLRIAVSALLGLVGALLALVLMEGVGPATDIATTQPKFPDSPVTLSHAGNPSPGAGACCDHQCDSIAPAGSPDD